jgi:hypothetical protein
VSEFCKPRPEWTDIGGPTPLSWRFGLYRRWHPDFDFLYEINVGEKVSFGACMAFTNEEVTEVHPAHQSIENPSIHIADCTRNPDNL